MEFLSILKALRDFIAQNQGSDIRGFEDMDEITNLERRLEEAQKSAEGLAQAKRDLLASQEALEKSLGAPLGDGGKRGYFFHQKSSGDLTDETCWSEKVDWLHQMQDLYVRNLKEVL